MKVKKGNHCIGGDNMFEILGTIDNIMYGAETKHIAERTKRIALVERLLINEDAKPCGAYIINKGHRNGYEIHVIYNNGIIRIYNQKTGKHITDLIARIPQVERYGIKVTKTMRRKIRTHIKAGMNSV